MKHVWEVLAEVILGVYWIGFLLALIVNLVIGPVTVPLALVRAWMWPIWMAFGVPHGVIGGF